MGFCLGSVGGVCLRSVGGLLSGSSGGLLGVCWGFFGGPLEEVLVDESSSDVVTVESVEVVAEVLEEKFMVVEPFSANNNLRVKFTSILGIIATLLLTHYCIGHSDISPNPINYFDLFSEFVLFHKNYKN